MNQSILQAIENISTVIIEENINLESGNIPAATALLSRKEAALTALERLERPQTDAKHSDIPDLDPSLQDAVMQLDALLERNRTLLKQAMNAQTHIVRLLTKALPGDEQTHYGSSGSYARQRSRVGCAFRNQA